MHIVWSIALSTDSTHIISGSSDNTVRVWDASTGAELKVLEGHTDFVHSVTFSTDGTCIVSGSSDKSVQVWDASTGAQVKMPSIHTDSLNSITSPADNTCITSDDEFARLYIVGHAYHAWTTYSKLWICSVLGRYQLMWVPVVVYPSSVLAISHKGPSIVHFQGCNISC